jgi:predicted nucleic acid-binding protein
MSSTPDFSAFVNTSPLLYLHQVGQLEILSKLYGSVIAPTAVEQELAVGKSTGVDVPDLSLLGWLQVHDIGSETPAPNVIDLGQGEAEVISLGLKNRNSLLILDDQLGRRTAHLYRLRFTGTLGVLIKAKQAGYIEAVAPIITKLQEKGLWLTNSVIESALNLAEEDN